MKKYLLTIVCILLISAFSNIGFAEKIYTERLGNIFISGDIKPGDTIVQAQEFLISDKKGTWFISANIKSDKFTPERIFSLPYRNYITSGKQDNCYEEFYIYSFPKTNILTLERHIFNFTTETQSYESYEGSIIRFKLK